MDITDIIEYITALDDVSVVEANGNFFFSCTEDQAAQSAHWLPFATLITNDAYDQYSELDRPGVYRLNIGVSRPTFQKHFDPNDAPITYGEPALRSVDYTALDRIMPHPIYADQHWVSVLSLTLSTFENVKPLLIEAHDRAVARQRAREQHQRD